MKDENETISIDSNISNKHTIEDLMKMQSYSLERKIEITQARIIEWYIKNDGKVYVSFSGGKDSTVLLDIVRKLYPDVPAVYVDTGLEFPEIKKFVKAKENVTILRPEMGFRHVIEKYGYPIISKNVSRAVHDVKKLGDNCWFARAFDGRETGLYNYKKWKFLIDAPFKVSSQCCDVMKKKPLKKYGKETGNKPIIATMAYESQARKVAWLHNGCNSFDSKNAKSQPMNFWTEQDVLEYIKRYNLDYASVYGDIVSDKNGKFYTTKCDRTGCVFCGFGCHVEKSPNRFQRLKQTHPQLWTYCMKPWDEGGLGMKEVLEFINVKAE